MMRVLRSHVAPSLAQNQKTIVYPANIVPVTSPQNTTPSVTLRCTLRVRTASYRTDSSPVNRAMCGQPRGSPTRRSSTIAAKIWEGSARHIIPDLLQIQIFLQKVGHSIVNALKMFPPGDDRRSIV